MIFKIKRLKYQEPRVLFFTQQIKERSIFNAFKKCIYFILLVFSLNYTYSYQLKLPIKCNYICLSHLPSDFLFCYTSLANKTLNIKFNAK